MADWRLIVSIGLGAAAVYMMLPRPAGGPRRMGGLLGAAALLSTLVLVLHPGTAGAERCLFYAFAALGLLSAGMMITHQNPVHAALWFVLVVLSTCGLFLLLSAPFLMAATVIVYAGAIVVTFLFLIMLAQQAGLSDADRRSREPLLATITGFVLLGALVMALPGRNGAAAGATWGNAIAAAPAQDNVAALGQSLFTDFFVPVELAGIILLVATIGSVAIASVRAGGRRP